MEIATISAIAPAVMIASRQSNVITMTGKSAPAKALPAGPPVYLIEKIMGLHFSGETRARMWVLTGFTGP